MDYLVRIYRRIGNLYAKNESPSFKHLILSKQAKWFFSRLKWSGLRPLGSCIKLTSSPRNLYTKDVKIISINIRFENEKDEHPWSERKHLIAKLIQDFSPAFFGTQEGRKPQLYDLAQQVPSFQLVNSHRDWIEERMYPCLFIDPQQIKVVQSHDFWLSETPEVAGSKSFNSAFPRLCTWAILEHKSAQRILVANVHLDHMLTETRQAQAKVLCEQLKLINKEELPLFLMGDFNEGPEGEVRNCIRLGLSQNTPIQDGWEVLKKPELSSFHKFRGEIPDGKRIDWILHTAPYQIEDIQLDKRHQAGLYPSDHYPVLASFKC